MKYENEDGAAIKVMYDDEASTEPFEPAPPPPSSLLLMETCVMVAALPQPLFNDRPVHLRPNRVMSRLPAFIRFQSSFAYFTIFFKNFA